MITLSRGMILHASYHYYDRVTMSLHMFSITYNSPTTQYLFAMQLLFIAKNLIKMIVIEKHVDKE